MLKVDSILPNIAVNPATAVITNASFATPSSIAVKGSAENIAIVPASDSSAIPSDVENPSIILVSTSPKFLTIIANVTIDIAITPKIRIALPSPVIFTLLSIFKKNDSSSNTNPNPVMPFIMASVGSVPIFSIAMANKTTLVARPINPSPLDMPSFIFLVSAKNADSSSNTSPSPVIPFTMVPVSNDPISLIAVANRLIDTASNISAAPLNNPSFIFLVSAKNAASSSNTSPSPVIPFISVSVDNDPIWLIASANKFIDTATNISDALLNKPSFIFLVNAKNAANSSKTMPSPAIPLTSASVGSDPILLIALANRLIDTATNIRAAPLNILSLVFLINAINIASPRSTTPSPAIPLTSASVDSDPIVLIALANKLIEIAVSTKAVPVNTLSLVFLTNAINIASSRSTAPSPAIPFTKVLLSSTPILPTALANKFIDTATNIRAAPLNILSLVFLINAINIASSRSTAPSPANPLFIASGSISPREFTTSAILRSAAPSIKILSPAIAIPRVLPNFIPLNKNAKPPIAISIPPITYAEVISLSLSIPPIIVSDCATINKALAIFSIVLPKSLPDVSLPIPKTLSIPRDRLSNIPVTPVLNALPMPVIVFIILNIAAPPRTPVSIIAKSNPSVSVTSPDIALMIPLNKLLKADPIRLLSKKSRNHVNTFSSGLK